MEGVMSSLGSAVMNALGSAVLAELLLAWGVDDDIRALQRRAETINAVLRDAETRSINDEALSKWLADLKDVAFDAEDVLDELQTDAALLEGKKEKLASSPIKELNKVPYFKNCRGIFVGGGRKCSSGK